MSTNIQTNSQAKSRTDKEIIIYQHSELIYWWVVWLYGFFCAGLTYWQGVPVGAVLPSSAVLDKISKDVSIYPDTLLGVSFVLLVLCLAVFTNLKSRVINSLAVLLALVIAAGILTLGFDHEILKPFQLIIYITWELYLLFSLVLFGIWTLFIFVFEKRTYYYFRPHAFGIVTIGQGQQNFVFQALATAKSYPPLVNRLLGLWLTGDLKVVCTPGGQYEVKSVWRVREKENQISELQA